MRAFPLPFPERERFLLGYRLAVLHESRWRQEREWGSAGGGRRRLCRQTDFRERRAPRSSPGSSAQLRCSVSRQCSSLARNREKPAPGLRKKPAMKNRRNFGEEISSYTENLAQVGKYTTHCVHEKNEFNKFVKDIMSKWKSEISLVGMKSAWLTSPDFGRTSRIVKRRREDFSSGARRCNKILYNSRRTRNHVDLWKFWPICFHNEMDDIIGMLFMNCDFACSPRFLWAEWSCRNNSECIWPWKQVFISSNRTFLVFDEWHW